MNIFELLYRFFTSFFFLPIWIGNHLARRNLLLPLYARKKKGTIIHKEKTVVYMCLKETTASGGLSDRLRGLVSVYAECKRKGIPFKAYFEVPPLDVAFVPNKYNWHIDTNEIEWDTRKSYPCMILTYHKNIKNRWQKFAQLTMLRHYIRKDYKQIHVYTNMVSGDNQYSELFNELFKPSPALKEQLNYHLSKIGGKRNYISCTFRFRQLLGDLKEGGVTLPEHEREPYIRRCLDTINQLHNANLQDTILVTSDSVTFNNRVASLPYVYTIPGLVVHMGFTYNADKATYLKSFVDYFMLSFAREVYLVRDDLMYHSGFPYRAALLGHSDYKEIQLTNQSNF